MICFLLIAKTFSVQSLPSVKRPVRKGPAHNETFYQTFHPRQETLDDLSVLIALVSQCNASC